MELNELINLLNRVLRMGFNSVDGKTILFSGSSFYGSKKDFLIPEDVVKEMISCNDVLLEDPVRIQSIKYCEFLLKDSSRFISRLYDTNEYPDNDNMLRYIIGRPSLRMTMALLKYADNGHEEIAQEIRMRFRRMCDRYEDDARALFSEVAPIRSKSLRICLDKDNPNDKIDFLTLCTSFCFVSGYNLGNVLLPITSLADLIDVSVSRRIRRGHPEDIQPPRRKYINELVHFYARGNSGESWDYKYLSYYHVLEYFFEKVYSDNVVAMMRLELTRPGFSYKRDKDLLNFEKIMRKSFKDMSSSGGINEVEALTLTLKKYVPDLTRLYDNLNEASSNIVNYLKTTETPFSANKVDFSVSDTTGIYTSLTNRIYATRNAIAHSKESVSKKKFVPFKHDKALVNEVLLMRIIAEEVIINSSKDL